MQPVYGFRGNIYCRVESECQIRTPDVIINGLGYAHNIQSLFRQHISRLHRAVTTYADKAIEPELLVVFLDEQGLSDLVLLFTAALERLLTRGAKYCASQCKYAGEVSFGQLKILLVDQPRVTVTDTNDLHAIPYYCCLAYTPDCCINAGTVTASCKDSNCLSFTVLAHLSYASFFCSLSYQIYK